MKNWTRVKHSVKMAKSVEEKQKLMRTLKVKRMKTFKKSVQRKTKKLKFKGLDRQKRAKKEPENQELENHVTAIPVFDEEIMEIV